MTMIDSKQYFVVYEGDYANQYRVYIAADKAVAARFLAECPKAERIDRDEAIRLGWTRPNQARKAGEQWNGGFALPTGSTAHTLEESMRDCEVATETDL
jgi:hypothetical protein